MPRKIELVPSGAAQAWLCAAFVQWICDTLSTCSCAFCWCSDGFSQLILSMSLDPGSFIHMASDTANVGSSRDVSFRCLMGERARQWVVRHLPRRCFENEPSAVYAARLCDNAGFRFCRTHVLSTAVVGTSRDFSLHVATGSNRPCYAVHPDDSACPLFWVHSLCIANFCDTSTHLHVRVTSMVPCCLEAPSGDSVCPRIFLTHGYHLAACMVRHVGQWTVQCAP